METVVIIEHNQIANKPAISRFFKGMEDGRHLITSRPLKRRSLPQNSFFHAILPDIKEGLRDVGYNEIRTEDDAKDFVKSLFLKRVIKNEITGEEVVIIRRTRDLQKDEMQVFLDDVIMWAAQYLSINITSPGEQQKMFL